MFIINILKLFSIIFDSLIWVLILPFRIVIWLIKLPFKIAINTNAGRTGIAKLLIAYYTPKRIEKSMARIEKFNDLYLQHFEASKF